MPDKDCANALLAHISIANQYYDVNHNCEVHKSKDYCQMVKRVDSDLTRSHQRVIERCKL